MKTLLLFMSLTISGLVHALPIIEEVSQYQKRIASCDICPSFSEFTITTFSISLATCKELAVDDFEVVIGESIKDIEGEIDPFVSVRLIEKLVSVQFKGEFTDCPGPTTTRYYKVSTSELKADEHYVLANTRALGKGQTINHQHLLEVVRLVLESKKEKILYLYHRELRRNPTLEGNMVVEVTLPPTGHNSVLIKSNDLKSPRLSDRVKIILETTQFAEKSIGTWVVTFPIEFRK